ncbi:MAG TPA: MFS transporter [Ktedonobacterales bacterium]
MPNPPESSPRPSAERPRILQRPDGSPSPAPDTTAPQQGGSGSTAPNDASASAEPAEAHRGSRPMFRPVGTPIRAPKDRQQLQERVVAAQQAPARPGAAPGGVAALAQAARQRIERLALTVFINRDFALLWWGQAISSVGDYAWDTALVLWIANTLAHNQSWAPAAIAGVILAAALPQIVIGPIAGVFVDRWDKRRTMVVAAGLQAIFAILLIPTIVGMPLPLVGSARLPTFWTLGVIYADVALITICSQFYLPAQFALIRDIAPDDKEDQAQEMTQAIQGLAVIIGPPVAALLVFGAGIGWAMLLNALSFVVAFAAAVAIHAPQAASSLKPGETGHFSREFLDGVSYVLGHTVLRTILIAEVLTWLGFGALQTLGYFFITENLHATPSMYGYFGAVFGVGAVIGGLLVTFMGQRAGLERMLWVSLVTSGVFVVMMSHLTSFPLALVAAFFFGVSATAIIVTAGPLAVDATERQFIGRVMAVINPVGRLAAFFSVVLAGALVSTVLAGFHATFLGIHFGAVDTIFTGTGLLAIAGGIYARRSLANTTPAHARRPPDSQATRERAQQRQ